MMLFVFQVCSRSPYCLCVVRLPLNQGRENRAWHPGYPVYCPGWRPSPLQQQVCVAMIFAFSFSTSPHAHNYQFVATRLDTVFPPG